MILFVLTYLHDYNDIEDDDSKEVEGWCAVVEVFTLEGTL